MPHLSDAQAENRSNTISELLSKTTYTINTNKKKGNESMKKMKKLASLLLALVMILSMTATAFAANTNGSITITNPAEGQIYNVYLMFELESYNSTTGAYSYKITEDWREFVTDGAGKDYFSINTQDYVTLKDGVTVEDDSDTAAAIAKAAVAYATSKNLSPAATLPENDSYTANGLTLGYYVLDSSLGALCDLTTTKPSAIIQEKNEVPTPDKTVKEDSTGIYGDSNTAQIGDTVEFKTVIHAKKGAQNYKLHDQMEAGLTLNKDSIVVTAGDTDLAKGTDYTVAYEVTCKDSQGNNAVCDFEITFSNDYLATITADTDIVVTYTAVLNENAEIADATNDNDTVLDYGDNSHSEWDKTTTKTFMFDIIKTDSSLKLLQGAKFELYDAQNGGNKINLVKNNDGTYRVATTQESADEGFTSAVIEAGKATVKGLDADTTYWLEEIEAPAGYNKLAGRVEVKMENSNLTTTMTGDIWKDDNGGVQITNQTGVELPSTGGIGTTIFYVLGAILVLAAGVILVTRKRMSMND